MTPEEWASELESGMITGPTTITVPIVLQAPQIAFLKGRYQFWERDKEALLAGFAISMVNKFMYELFEPKNFFCPECRKVSRVPASSVPPIKCPVCGIFWNPPERQ